ncbi:hypothetical protein CTEN210_11568 [Chaetoceros tenuissimus]|uniref:Uncharacterized protein n=1 Tax=Chaetoceros tenuissimus TaxID=426638 RepID=A0AAD3CZH6_9STRA|nr:hypothetical protein CTEN210_11568 [Chaetoceros tenuissimus]
MSKFCSIAMALMTGAASANPFAVKTTPTNAKADYNARLVAAAIPVRKLEIATDVEVDLTNYSLRFEKCQVVNSYSQDEVAVKKASTVLSTSQFVLFRFCPSGICSNSCDYNYDEYMVDMEKYLEIATDYRKEEQEEMCNTCEKICDNNTYYNDDNADTEEEADGDDSNGERRKLAMIVDCDTCQSECRKIENMEANYYVDATKFIKCQQIKEDDGYNGALYAGPICASQGAKIKIGVFKDEDCMFFDSSKDVETYIVNEDGYPMRLSHALLKTTYSSSYQCISCVEDVDDQAKANAGNKEVCAELYDAAAKSEMNHSSSSNSAGFHRYTAANWLLFLSLSVMFQG